MQINITKTKIDKNEQNKVSSHLIFEPHRRQKSENLKFYDKGIFSKKIFGNLYRCDCGKVTKEGYCEECGCRVINPKNIPSFYIDLSTEVPVMFADYNSLNYSNKEDIKDILEYKKFYYNGNIEEFRDDLEFSNYDCDKVFIGTEALRKIGIPDKWIEENTVDYLNISHPNFRPIVIDNKNNPFITGINNLYSNIIYKINNVIDMRDYVQNSFYLLSQYGAIVELYNKIMESLFEELHTTKYSILKSEIISHPITGAVRAVLLNRHDIDEDVILIGDTLVKTLWPYLYKKHNGNMIKINQELIDKDMYVVINRPPTICHLSIMALKPRIASIYPFGKTEGSDNCLKQNNDYLETAKIGTFHEKDGDIEKYGYDEIDTCGLRCVAMNPIVFDGLAADTDGDVLLVIAIYSKKAAEEAKTMIPSKNFINYENGTIRNHIINDFIYTDNDDLIY